MYFQKYVYKKKIFTVLFRMVDIAGGILFCFAKIAGRRSPEEYGRILVIRCDHIGDVIAALTYEDAYSRHDIPLYLYELFAL